MTEKRAGPLPGLIPGENDPLRFAADLIELPYPIGKRFDLVPDFYEGPFPDSSVHIGEYAKKIIVGPKGGGDVCFQEKRCGMEKICVTQPAFPHPRALFHLFPGDLPPFLVEPGHFRLLRKRLRPGESGQFPLVIVDGRSAVGVTDRVITGAEIGDLVFQGIAQQRVQLLFEIAPGSVSALFVRNHFRVLLLWISIQTPLRLDMDFSTGIAEQSFHPAAML